MVGDMFGFELLMPRCLKDHFTQFNNKDIFPLVASDITYRNHTIGMNRISFMLLLL